MDTNQTKRKQTAWRWLIVVLCGAAVIAVAVAAYMQFFGQKNVDVTTFEACESAGGRVTNDPRQCVIDGKTFTSQNSTSDDTASTKPMTDEEISKAYVGLSEDEAIARAKSEDRQARVIVRDGESLNRTGDLQNGRLNFTVKDGEVIAVEVEHISIRR